MSCARLCAHGGNVFALLYHYYLFVGYMNEGHGIRHMGKLAS